MAAKTSEWRPGPTVCRCCLTEGCYKDISTEYFWMGKREVYAEMLANTFDLSIAYSQSGGPNSNSRLICEPCISRLRDAADFKRQVAECEKTFLQHLDPSSSNIIPFEVTADEVTSDLEKEVKLEQIKIEKLCSDDEFDAGPDFDADDDDDLDDEPLTKLASRIPKTESMDAMDLMDNATATLTLKRKSTSKTKTSPAKKIKKKEPKASASKVKPEKKKKETTLVSNKLKAKRNAEVVLQYSTVYPFRLRGKQLLCVYCCEEYDEPATYRRHIDEEHQSYPVSMAFAHCGTSNEYLKVDCTNLRCRPCLQPFETLGEIVEHIKARHPNDKLDTDFEIGLQPYKIDTDRWICYLCGLKLPTINKLCRHTTSHYQKYTCECCGKSYLTNDALKYHIKCSHALKPQCRKCWKQFPTAEMKRDHLKVSKACWQFCCVECGERFMSWECKQKHLVEAHGRPKASYVCPDCGLMFEQRRNFYYHYRTSHTEESFTCSCCGIKCGSKLQLEDHMLVHTGEKRFECGVCRKPFTRKKSLTQHMWIHSEKKRFACPACDKQFAQKVSLKSHIKSHHPEIETS